MKPVTVLELGLAPRAKKGTGAGRRRFLAVKVRPSVKRICEKCKIVKRKGNVVVICKNPKHKQRQGN